MYENAADSYAAIMDAEIDLPVYSDILSRLAERTADISGALIDTSCGPGHMLSRYHERYDPDRKLVGVDISPQMVAIASTSLGPAADVRLGDMRDLDWIQTESVAAGLSFFAIHHIEPEEIAVAFQEWARVMCPGGQFVVAAWEGTGLIDYGEESDILAIRYTAKEVTSWVDAAGFAVNRCVVEPVVGMPMDALYLEATRVSA